MTRTEALAEARRRLREGGVETPDLDARVLTAAALGVEEIALVIHGSTEVSEAEVAQLDDWLKRRLGGEPVARLVGRREFWGLDFALSPETLVPRPDTETLVEAVLERLPDRTRALRILDLGTGSGCILLALLYEYHRATGIGVDLSAGAVAAARANAERLGLEARASFRVGTWDDGLDGTFDLIVSNPPYIPADEIEGLEREVRLHDPRLALDGGADGLDAYRVLARLIPRRLADGGAAVIEVGIGQRDAVAALMAAQGLCVTSRDDLSGIPRALVVSVG